MSLATSNRDGGKTSESGHLRALYKAFPTGGVFQGLAVSQRGAGANMSVDVSIGDALIPRSDATYAHPAWADAVYNQVIAAADASNPRRDIIVMYIDYGQTPSTAVSNNTNGVVKIKVVAGTPAGSPSDPNDAAIQSSVGSGNPWIKLARVRVGAGVTTISNSVIDDLRTFASPVLGSNAAVGEMINGKIVRTVSSNNITVAIKTLAGNDPSATDPVYVRIGDTVRVITAALSVTKNAGTNWFGSGSSHLATSEVDYFVYLGYNTTDGVTIGFARIPFALTYSDFSTTTTNEKYAAISTITNAAAGDVYQVVGRFNATLSAAASYNWSVPATSIIINRPIYQTRWLNLTAAGVPAVGWSSTTYAVCRYRVDYNRLDVTYTVNGTSNSTDTRVKLPFSVIDAAGGQNQNYEGTTGLLVNNGTIGSSPGRVYVDTATDATLLFIVPSAGTGSWTGSGTKAVRLSAVIILTVQ